MELKKHKAYKLAFDIACNELLATNIETQLVRAGLEYTVTNKVYTVTIPFFNDHITLTFPECSFKSSHAHTVTLVTKIIILHYILHASGIHVGDHKIPYEDIPGCRSYAPVFTNRVIKPLLSAFGYSSHSFLEAGLSLNGNQEPYGNASFTLTPLPRIPITFILWEGSYEFSPSLTILFDPSIHTYLPLEDIVVIAKLTSTRILKAARLHYQKED